MENKTCYDCKIFKEKITEALELGLKRPVFVYCGVVNRKVTQYEENDCVVNMEQDKPFKIGNIVIRD